MNKIGSRETVKCISAIRVRCKMKVVLPVLLLCFASYIYYNHTCTSEIAAHDYTQARVILQQNNDSSVQKPCYTTMEDEIYAYGDVIFEAVGSTELQQYEHLMKNNPNVSYPFGKPHLAAPPTGYTYTVMAVSSTTFVIKELCWEMPTGGGSSFLIRTDSTSTQICPYTDSFNGTYVVNCPLPRCTCRNITVLLQYTNFTAYTGSHTPIWKLLWQERVCDNTTTPSTLIQRNLSSTEKKSIATWYHNEDRLVATLLDGEAFPDLNISDLCGCVKKYRKLFLVRSSHMRFKFDYIIDACYEMPSNVPVQHNRLVVENVSFISVTRMSEFVVLWRMTLEKESLGEGDMVVVQTGAHDMALACLHDTMGVYTGKLVIGLSDLRQKSLKRGFQLLVLTTPPFPEANIELKAKGNRNNYALAAFNRKLKMLLTELGVEVFDEFSLFLVQQDNNACGCHYMCRGIVNNTSYIYGEAGRIAMRILISKHLC